MADRLSASRPGVTPRTEAVTGPSAVSTTAGSPGLTRRASAAGKAAWISTRPGSATRKSSEPAVT